MDDGLMDGFGAPSAKFEAIGDTVEGVIVDVSKGSVTDISTGEIRRFSDGSPIPQYVFTIETKLSTGPDDDGRRRIFAKNRMLTAIREAIKASGHRGSVVGGSLKVQFHATEASKTKGYSPTKLFRARFTPPVETVTGGDWSEPQSAPPQGRRNNGAVAPRADDDIPF